MSILKDYSELKAQIRLSPYANFIIQSDIINFKVTKASSMPAFINKIVYNLYEAWDTYKVYKDKGNEEISKQSSDYSIINNILMLNFTETKKTKSLCKPIRLKISAELSRKLNENSKYSEYEVWNAENVKEMLEFYARLSYDIRERIIFNPLQLRSSSKSHFGERLAVKETVLTDGFDCGRDANLHKA